MAIQFTMTAIACNLKRMVKLLFYRGCGKAHQGIPVFQGKNDARVKKGLKRGKMG
jgi:hypothetical protein